MHNQEDGQSLREESFEEEMSPNSSPSQSNNQTLLDSPNKDIEVSRDFDIWNHIDDEKTLQILLKYYS